MSSLSSFSEKLIILRNSHNLTLLELSLFINQNSHAVIKRWESQKNWPSMEVMILLSRLFGVSIDWLLNNSDSPYNEELISSLESELITSQVHLGKSKITLFNPFGFPESYYNPELRKENYSLAVRANLLFLMVHEAMYVAYIYHHHHYHYLSSPPPLETSLKVNFCKGYNDYETWKKATKRHEHYLSLYLNLISQGKNATPIFDISK